MIHGTRYFEYSCGMRCSGTTEIKATNAKAIRKGPDKQSRQEIKFNEKLKNLTQLLFCR